MAQITIIQRETTYNSTTMRSFAIVFPASGAGPSTPKITLPLHVYAKEYQSFTQYPTFTQVPNLSEMTSMNGFTLKKKGDAISLSDFWTTIVELTPDQSIEVYQRLKALL